MSTKVFLIISGLVVDRINELCGWWKGFIHLRDTDEDHGRVHTAAVVAQTQWTDLETVTLREYMAELDTQESKGERLISRSSTIAGALRFAGKSPHLKNGY